MTRVIKSVYEKQPLELKAHLGQMIDGAINFEKYSDLNTFKSTNDLQFTVMLSSVVDWRKSFKEDFCILHDATSNFMRQKETWDKITGTSIPKQDHPFGDGSEVEFPLRVIETRAIDSKLNYSIQLSDLLAGYASKHFDLSRPEEERYILDSMVDHGLINSSFNSIRPGVEFPTFPPERLNGPDAVDRIIKMMKSD